MMKAINLSNFVYASALGMTLGLFSGAVSADTSSQPDAQGQPHMQDQQTQPHDGTPPRDRELDSTTRSGADVPGHQDNNPAGTDATRSVPGAPDAGTNPATEPGARHKQAE